MLFLMHPIYGLKLYSTAYLRIARQHHTCDVILTKFWFLSFLFLQYDVLYVVQYIHMGGDHTRPGGLTTVYTVHIYCTNHSAMMLKTTTIDCHLNHQPELERQEGKVIALLSDGTGAYLRLVTRT
jgi:hypothetical protein